MSLLKFSFVDKEEEEMKPEKKLLKTVLITE